ncbi:hypothetical protein ACET3Z_005826 [Daucus carota]
MDSLERSNLHSPAPELKRSTLKSSPPQLVFNKGFSIFRYAIPFGLNSKYAHPDEILFLGFATITGPAITGPHLITLWLWM